jgi:Holliday junction resolvase RusA-like endonuclease
MTTLSEILTVIESFKEDEYSFFVNGIPCPQGSKNAFARIKTMPNGKKVPVAVMVEQSKGLPVWRDSVKRAALASRPAGWKTQGIFIVNTIYHFPRPKLHYKTNGELKPGAEIIKVSTPDRDKLDRAIGDSLTKVVFDDDAQSAIGFSVKLFCSKHDNAGAFITVCRLSPLAGAALAWMLG